MNSFNNSYTGLRLDILKYVDKKNSTVLDVGCATGENGQYLLKKRLAQTVFGIELDKEMAAEAAEKVSKVFQGDLNNPEFCQKIVKESPLFDYILFGDILEHLVYPQKVLKDLCKLLEPKGTVIISVPNIRHLELFIQVYIKGTWPKNTRGIFDATHLRWFTQKDLAGMMEYSGLKVIKHERKLRARDSLDSVFNWKYTLLKRIDKDLVTFQHIMVGVNE